MPPILILAFNRPDTLRRLIDSLRPLHPPILYCAQDGPRKNKATDKVRCKEVTKVFDEIDWKCKRYFLIRKTNLGCQKGVSEAISWFFSKEEEGIILEDDCLPDPTFFHFCSELLKKYRYDTRIMHISGNNFQKENTTGYRFSQYPHCWGWATWRRAWQHFDTKLPNWLELKNHGWLRSRVSHPISVYFWRKIFDGVYQKKIDSWAIPWVYTVWTQNGLSVLPNSNLVTNIGFGKDSTHTPDSLSPLGNRSALPLRFPLPHPIQVIRDNKADAWDQVFVYEQRTLRQLALRVRSFFIQRF